MCYHGTCFDMNEVDGRLGIACQLYNVLHLPKSDSDDTKVKVQELTKVCSGLAKSFHTKDPTVKCNNSTRPSASDSINTGANPGGATEHAILKDRGYEVEPHVVIDDTGATYELLGKV